MLDFSAEFTGSKIQLDGISYQFIINETLNPKNCNCGQLESMKKQKTQSRFKFTMRIEEFRCRKRNCSHTLKI
jgi:hypothetical protein